MPTPRSVDIDLTTRCNLRCTYCYHFSSPGDVEQDLPTAEWLQFFAELGRCQVMHLTLAGGEPFMRRDLRELLQGIVDNRMRYALLSNGTLVDDEIAGFIAATHRCDYIQFSIDGSRPEVHDQVRGKGTFAKALHGLEIVRAHNIPIAVRVTINRFNVDDLESIAQLLLDRLQIDGFSTNAASYLGLCQQNVAEVGLDLAQRQQAMQTLVRLNEKYGGRISAAAGPLADAHMWAELENARITGIPPSFRGGSLTACGCVFDRIAVRADGVVVPCIMLSHIELGRINRDDFAGIWRNHPEMVRMRQRSKIELDQFEFCRGCPYIAWCTGNCPGLAFSLTGQVDHPSPDACLRRYLDAGGKLPIAVQEQVG